MWDSPGVRATNDGATDQPDSTASAEQWRPLGRDAIAIWRVRAAAVAFVALVLGGLVVFVVRMIEPQPATGLGGLGRAMTVGPLTAVVGAGTATTMVAAAGSIIVAPRRFRSWRWRLGDGVLVVERGWWRHRRVQAPIADIHTLSEHTGPLLRRWHVHKVRAYASGPVGSVSLPVVEVDDVTALRRGLGFDDDQS